MYCGEITKGREGERRGKGGEGEKEEDKEEAAEATVHENMDLHFHTCTLHVPLVCTATN